MQPEPVPRDDELDVFGVTHSGRVREHNEDQFLVGFLRKQVDVLGTSLPDPEGLPLRGERLALLMLVADGVGGHAAGAEASRTALEAVVQYVNRSLRCFHAATPGEEMEFLNQLRGSITECQNAVLAKAEGSREGMATTLTTVMIMGFRAYVVQVGDSRCYWLRDGQLHQITRDQTLAQDLIDRGELAEGAAEATQLGHVLVSAIGGPEASPVLSTIDLRRDDILLLCSDGLTAEVPDDLIRRRLLALESSEQACRALIDDALEAGGRDNVTVVIGRVRPDGPPPS
jgi:protein phosphatase